MRAAMSKRAGQEQFLILLDEHKKILFKIANSYCRQASDREDLVQEMVLQLWRSFGRYDPMSRFTTWMYRVALNVAISFYRRETRRPRTATLDEQRVLQISPRSRESEAASRDADWQLLESFIRQLNEFDRALVILYLDGNRHDTIAEILGISETNVGTKIGRLKQRLRQMSADDEGETVSHGTR
jgi:RNA polymerase sigma factor (sigma-70 family)